MQVSFHPLWSIQSELLPKVEKSQQKGAIFLTFKASKNEERDGAYVLGWLPLLPLCLQKLGCCRWSEGVHETQLVSREHQADGGCCFFCGLTKLIEPIAQQNSVNFVARAARQEKKKKKRWGLAQSYSVQPAYQHGENVGYVFMMCNETINWQRVITYSFVKAVIIHQYKTGLSQQLQLPVFQMRSCRPVQWVKQE